jgi:hypothetical protein
MKYIILKYMLRAKFYVIIITKPEYFKFSEILCHV